MAKKHKSHDDGTSIDDEPEADWTEDTAAEQPAEEQHIDPTPEAAPPVEAPPKPPGERLKAALAELDLCAQHNSPVPLPVLKELREIADAIRDH